MHEDTMQSDTKSPHLACFNAVKDISHKTFHAPLTSSTKRARGQILQNKPPHNANTCHKTICHSHHPKSTQITSGSRGRLVKNHRTKSYEIRVGNLTLPGKDGVPIRGDTTTAYLTRHVPSGVSKQMRNTKSYNRKPRNNKRKKKTYIPNITLSQEMNLQKYTSERQTCTLKKPYFPQNTPPKRPFSGTGTPQ